MLTALKFKYAIIGAGVMLVASLVLVACAVPEELGSAPSSNASNSTWEYKTISGAGSHTGKCVIYTESFGLQLVCDLNSANEFRAVVLEVERVD